MIEDYLVLETNGFKAFIAHGDGYVKKRQRLQNFKSSIKKQICSGFVRINSPGFWGLAGKNHQWKIERLHRVKNYGKVDGLAETAKQIMDEGYDFVIFAHSHIKKLKNVEPGTM